MVFAENLSKWICMQLPLLPCYLSSISIRSLSSSFGSTLLASRSRIPTFLSSHSAGIVSVSKSYAFFYYPSLDPRTYAHVDASGPCCKCGITNFTMNLFRRKWLKTTNYSTNAPDVNGVKMNIMWCQCHANGTIKTIKKTMLVDKPKQKRHKICSYGLFDVFLLVVSEQNSSAHM